MQRLLLPVRELWRFCRSPGEPLPGFPSRGRAFAFYAHLFVLLLVIQLAWVFAGTGLRAEEGASFRAFANRGWFLAFGLVVVAPVLEEWMFRSWLKASWDVPSGSPWLVPVLVLPQFVSGLMFAYARLRSGLLAAIALHAALNTFVVLVAGAWSQG